MPVTAGCEPDGLYQAQFLRQCSLRQVGRGRHFPVYSRDAPGRPSSCSPEPPPYDRENRFWARSEHPAPAASFLGTMLLLIARVNR